MPDSCPDLPSRAEPLSLLSLAPQLGHAPGCHLPTDFDQPVTVTSLSDNLNRLSSSVKCYSYFQCGNEVMRMMILLTSALTLFLARVSSGQGRPQSPHTNGHSMTGPSEGLVVSTSAGLVQGSKKILTDGLSVKTWVRIPYAEPPVGPLRFEVAQC